MKTFIETYHPAQNDQNDKISTKVLKGDIAHFAAGKNLNRDFLM